MKAGARLRARIARIARLSWERYQVAERECQRLEAAFEEALEHCYVHMRSEEMMDWMLSVLEETRSEVTEAEAEQLEQKLETAFQEYLCCRYGSHPAFEQVRRPRATSPGHSRQNGNTDTPAPAPIKKCEPIYVITEIS